MIASLRGILTDVQPGACVIECGGVGYLVQISTATVSGLPPLGREVSLRTRQVVREDAVQLFGFGDAEELKYFDLMIGVSGVGPRLALAVLSGLRPQALARAIAGEQVAALVQIPGIGRKTAERLVVELRDKIETPAITAAKETAVLPRAAEWDDAVAALLRLGYTAGQAQEAVRVAAAEKRDMTLEQVVRRALARLAKPAGATR